MNTFQQPITTAGRRLMPAADFKNALGGISEMSRWRREKARIGPMPVKMNGRNYYFQDEVEAYLDQLAASRPSNGAAGGDEAERTAATCTNEGTTGD